MAIYNDIGENSEKNTNGFLTVLKITRLYCWPAGLRIRRENLYDKIGNNNISRRRICV